MKRSISLDLTNDLDPGELREFLDSIPEGVKITTDITIDFADRPWESDRTRASLRAEWSD